MSGKIGASALVFRQNKSPTRHTAVGPKGSKMTVKLSLTAAVAACLFVTPLLSAPQQGAPGAGRANMTEASCERLLSNMRRDPSLNTWRNRMKVWPCYRASPDKQKDLALAAGHVVR